MALKTFNLDEQVYKKFSEYCKKGGISMSKKIENFIRDELEKIRGNNSKRGKMSASEEKEVENAKSKLTRNLADEHLMGKYC